MKDASPSYQPDTGSARSVAIFTAQPNPDLATAADLAGLDISVDAGLAEIAGARLSTGCQAMLVALNGAAEDAAIDAAATARDLVDDRGCGLVVVFERSQIDPVAAQLLGPPYHLLCEPAPAEIAVALVNARSHQSLLAGVAGDEAERLRQLNSEVARIADTLARLTHGDLTHRGQPAAGLREQPVAFAAESRATAPGKPIDAADVRSLIRGRRLRDSHFPPNLFADPAWDMLLDLYAAELEHRRVSVSSLCIAAAVPGTTALRWIGTMVDLGLLERQADPFDRRRAYLILTDRARDGMGRYFETLARAGIRFR